MSSRIVVLVVLLLAAPAAAAEPAGPFGPELASVQLGMTPAEVRAALAARAGVSLAALCERRVPPKPGKSGPSAEWSYSERVASHYPYGQPTCLDADCKRGWKEGDALGGKLEEFEYVLSATYYDRRRPEAGLYDQTTLEIQFSRVPRGERVVSIVLEQYYPNGVATGGKKVDHRPSTRAALQTLSAKLGKPAYCDPVGFVTYSGSNEQEFKPYACYWHPGDGQPGKLPEGIHHSLALHECRRHPSADAGKNVSFAKGDFGGPKVLPLMPSECVGLDVAQAA